ncbi:hypothetical protein [Streptomyces sp. NPDC057889]|uniref:hypothetical protein n=1 Tax=unclassified Streptomyces TaxID=2593676 RepID=UPI003689793A
MNEEIRALVLERGGWLYGGTRQRYEQLVEEWAAAVRADIAGRRQVPDTCTLHMIAITKTGATGAPESETLATLRAAVRQARVDAVLLTTPLAASECTRG